MFVRFVHSPITARRIVPRHYSSPSPKTDFHGSGATVISLVKRKNDIKGALQVFLRSPDPSGACVLISRLKDVDTITQVYHTLTEKSFINCRVLTSLVLAYRNNNNPRKALELIPEMKQRAILPDKVLFRSLLSVSIKAGDVDYLKELAFMMNWPKEMTPNEFNNTAVQVIEGFSALSHITDSLHTYEILKKHCAPSLSVFGALMKNYTTLQPERILELWTDMLKYNVIPDDVCLNAIITACANASAITTGRHVHHYIEKHVLLNLLLGTALVNMYGKCGEVKEAISIFNLLKSKFPLDVQAWTTIIQALGQNGYGREALKMFKTMSLDGKVKPDSVLFASLLNGCSHAFLVDEAFELIHIMKHTYQVTPTSVHYTCLVDALGRSGLLQEALGVVEKYAINDVIAWRALLGACHIYNNLKMGTFAAEQLFKLHPKDPSSCVMLSNILATHKQWKEVQKIREEMKSKKIMKIPGISHIEIDGKVYSFYVGDTSHPQSIQIEAKLHEIFLQLQKDGFVHDTSCVLHEVDEKEKIKHLCRHSEKLALGLGLINTPPGTKLLITKNLRMCRDCHQATKAISKIEKRIIVVRDANRFHHFDEGQCSCNDKF